MSIAVLRYNQVQRLRRLVPKVSFTIDPRRFTCTYQVISAYILKQWQMKPEVVYFERFTPYAQSNTTCCMARRTDSVRYKLAMSAEAEFGYCVSSRLYFRDINSRLIIFRRSVLILFIAWIVEDSYLSDIFSSQHFTGRCWVFTRLPSFRFSQPMRSIVLTQQSMSRKCLM